MSRQPTIQEIEQLTPKKRCLNCGRPLKGIVIPLYQNPLGIGRDIEGRFGIEKLKELDSQGAGVCVSCGI